MKQGSRGHLWTMKEWVDEVFSPHHGTGVCTTHWHTLTLHITPLDLWGFTAIYPNSDVPTPKDGQTCPTALERVHTQSSHTSGVQGNPISAMYQNFSVIDARVRTVHPAASPYHHVETRNGALYPNLDARCQDHDRRFLPLLISPAINRSRTTTKHCKASDTGC